MDLATRMTSADAAMAAVYCVDVKVVSRFRLSQRRA